LAGYYSGLDLAVAVGTCKSGKLQAELEKAARGTRGACGHFFRIEEILFQKSRTYIADLCGDFDSF
jgi:hypothetical protein